MTKTKIKEIIKHKKKGITVEEEVKKEVPVKAPVVLRMQMPAPAPVEANPEAKVVYPKKKSSRTSSHTSPPTPLQVLSTKRNWDKMQAASAIQHLKSLRNALSSGYTFQYVYQNGLEVMLTEIHKAIDLRWEQEKRAYHKKVEEEAFAAYPMSFRGSPAEINKRLDIMKAQEEF